ncbi:predicted protein [Arabidopsis lyrata subsp. lyrata]|uniref:Predicted protein n=1 Tax=Arabidopsis lyrata subsp. lyrata TaxID=81972 RepID=D7KY03_ARALL|nr:predicted protein [Arabidopsis lyrata subsp. lyrata]
MELDEVMTMSLFFTKSFVRAESARVKTKKPKLPKLLALEAFHWRPNNEPSTVNSAKPSITYFSHVM